MKLIFLGPPGAGKGTLAAKAAVELRLPHISTGDLFRAAIREASPLGLKVKGIIDSGGLVPDDLTIALVRERLSQGDANGGWILDGFPRTIPQAEALEGIEPADAVIDFDIDDDAVLLRLSGRRLCKACGTSYHVQFMPPKSPGLCDTCGQALITREDDKMEAIQRRLLVYREQTEPLIDFFRRRGKLVEINASGSPAEVFSAFCEKMAP